MCIRDSATAALKQISCRFVRLNITLLLIFVKSFGTVISFDTKDDVYGTCFEVFVPVSKKMLHEQYPTAWDGKDYFDEDYELSLIHI